MGDNKLFIFDIDSALDKLEDDLINTETKVTTQSQQIHHKDEEISRQRIDDEIVSNDVQENNGNDAKESSTIEALSESILDSE